ncbi:MAG: glycosyltransferase [Gemmatimonadales bacterium]
MPARADQPVAPVRLLDLDLSRPAAAVEDAAGFAGVQALVWNDGAPVGWITVPVHGGRCSAEAITGALAHLNGKEPAPVQSIPEQWPTVTVAVCTRDRTGDLERRLDALAAIQYPGLELLVVDNAPVSDLTERLVRGYRRPLRYVREPRPGLDWARNRAIQEATSEVLAFTDDDVIVDAGWVHALARVFVADPAVAAVTGLVVPLELDTEAQVLFERYRSFARGFVHRRVSAGGGGSSVAAKYGAAGDFGTGANMAFRRNLFDRIGPFDPALDVGTPTHGGGDLEMFFRVLKEGYTLIYEPRALVRHRHRRDLPGLRRQMTDHGIGFSSYLVRTALTYPEERAAVARLGAWWLAKTVFRIARPKAAPTAALRRLGLSELKGCLLGLGRYQQSRHAAALLGGSLP